MNKIFYHGTSSIYLSSIMYNGLITHKDYTYPNTSHYAKPIIYLTTNRDVAISYAYFRCYSDKLKRLYEEYCHKHNRNYKDAVGGVTNFKSVGGKLIVLTLELDDDDLFIHAIEGIDLNNLFNIECYTISNIDRSKILKINEIDEPLYEVIKRENINPNRIKFMEKVMRLRDEEIMIYKAMGLKNIELDNLEELIVKYKWM